MRQYSTLFGALSMNANRYNLQVINERCDQSVAPLVYYLEIMKARATLGEVK